jgi:hypothetical protein
MLARVVKAVEHHPHRRDTTPVDFEREFVRKPGLASAVYAVNPDAPECAFGTCCKQSISERRNQSGAVHDRATLAGSVRVHCGTLAHSGGLTLDTP